MTTSRAQVIFKAGSWLGCWTVGRAVESDWTVGSGAVREGVPFCLGGEGAFGGA